MQNLIFKSFNFVIHPVFFKSLADQKINKWKLENPKITIYAEMINELLRIQQFGELPGIPGQLVLHDSLNLLKGAKVDINEMGQHYFQLHVFADIKQYQFHYAVFYLDIENDGLVYKAIDLTEKKFSQFIDPVTISEDSCFIKNTMKKAINHQVKNILHSAPVDSKVYILSNQQGQNAVQITAIGNVTNRIVALPIQQVDLKSILDPATLVQESSMLNLSLMKWRIVPDMDLEKHTKLKCLILGAGTLGCNVIRCLLGWGCVEFTIVDSGNVSYSNPVRQSLFTVKDVGQPKAEAAKNRILEIAPYAKVEAVNMRIPMPDHDFTTEQVDQLWLLIKSHDAVFLLTDSRESRWLPTVLGRFENKIVLTAALGFESLLAMRHSKKEGCYFCSDVVAPVNSLEDRTLDQQCTVTRPGLSFIACGLLSEMIIQLLQTTDEKSLLGELPQQIRLFLNQNNYMSSNGVAYDKCTACSDLIMNKIKELGTDFIIECLKNPKSIEKLTGLEDLGEIDVEWDE